MIDEDCKYFSPDPLQPELDVSERFSSIRRHPLTANNMFSTRIYPLFLDLPVELRDMVSIIVLRLVCLSGLTLE